MNIPLSIAPLSTAARIDWRICVMVLLFAGCSLFLTTESNRFPSTYHPDEPSKAQQILKCEYNFHHPMLLLSATKVIITLANIPPDQDAVTIAGRQASALFTAGAIFCLVLIAVYLGGTLAGFAAGCLLVINHQLFELAHYFKEDTAVLFGLSVFFLGLLCYDRAPSTLRAFALGCALGLAISGKYLGIIAAPFAFGLLWFHRNRVSLPMVASFCFAGTVAVITLTNLPVLLNFHGFTDGFKREAEFLIEGHKGITRSVPHGVYWKVFLDSTMPVRWLPLVGLSLAAFYLALILRRRSARVSEWMIAAFPIVFGIVLSFFPKTHHRYFLPADAVLLMAAGLGMATLPYFCWKDRPWLGRTHVTWPVFLLLILSLGVQMPTFLAYFRGFKDDGRSELANYVRMHIPSGTVIVQDKRADLDALKLPYDFRGKLFAADVGTIDELRAQGIEYVAVAEGDYGRFFEKRLKPTEEGAANFARRRAFYERLFSEGEKLFDAPPGTLQYLQPHLMLYRLPSS